MRGFASASTLVVAALVVTTNGLASTASATATTPRSATAKNSEPGSVGVRLVDIPASLVNDPRARQYIIDNLAPGTTVRRRVEVSNTTRSPLVVDVYPDAATITHGAFYGAAGQTASDLTSWTSLSQSRLIVPAGGVARAEVTIAVPRDAAPGERYGVLWAQVSGGHDRAGIALVNRTGIRIYLSVGGHNPPQPDFTVDTITAAREADGRAAVRAQVHNTGGRALDLSGELRLSQVSGRLSAGPYRVQLGTTVAPGQSELVTALVTDQVANGPWNATLGLSSGLLHKTYQARITFPGGPGVSMAVTARPKTGRMPLLFVGVLLALVVLLAAALLLTTVRRRSGGAHARP